MQLGQPAYLKDAIKDGGGLIRARLGEGENIHRVLFGPIKVSLLYYPTLIEDDTTGEMVQRMKVIRRPPTGCPLDVLASLDKRVKASRGEKNPRSSLDPSTKWLYLVMDKNSDSYPKVQIAEYPYTVYKKLIELESSTSTKDTSKLRHGLVFMWDAIITKSVDKSKGIQFGTSYDVAVDPENKFTGKVPTSYLGMSATELQEKGINFDKFFSEEEMTTIQDSKVDLEEEGKPEELESITAKLTEFPIYLGATNQDGTLRFPSVDQMQEQLKKLGLQYLEGTEKPQTLSIEEDTTKKKPTKKVKKVVEAVAEDDTEDDTEDETEEAKFDDSDEAVVVEETADEETADEEFPEW